MSEGVTPSPKGTGWGFQLNTHHLFGGLVLAVVALVLLTIGFYLPNTAVRQQLWNASPTMRHPQHSRGLRPPRGPNSRRDH